MLEKKYNHKIAEQKWQKYWSQNEIHKFQDDRAKDQTFVIDTPPPTVSGVLHMGHVFSYTQADFIARFWRMYGHDVFYPMGFDDNGLPTERLVEKTKKIRAHQMSREEFIQNCQEIVDEAEEQFEELFNSIALSVDWDEKYQTISPKSQEISQASFVDLYKKGLVERKFEPVIWDIADQTALSQADLIDQEKTSSMNFIDFALENSDEKLTIMTTRPELLAACVAVMIHPDDERYQHLHGQNALTALFGVKVPIIADDSVLMDKGTGAVMCCTFGDETDIKWYKTHNLELRLIINKYGKIIPLDAPNSPFKGVFEKQGTPLPLSNEHHSYDALKAIYGQISGKKLKEAREIILDNLSQQNLLKSSEPITHAVKCAERSGSPIEIIVEPQWFIKILDKKEQLKQQAKKCQWFPEFMRIRVEQWIDNLSWDWCISRQRYFGVPFPIWYSKKPGEEGKIIAADFDELPINPLTTPPKGYKMEEVTPETDIMDTWATSSISPQLSSGLINPSAQNADAKQIARHEKLFPANLRPQAHEIIRTWAFYTIVKAFLHEERIPWQNLMISGWCLAADKTKMSKSKGNVVTPTALIQEKGSDVVRYWASTSHLGADTAYSDDIFKIGQKLLTKLYNAAKFASMNFDKGEGKITHISDQWITSRLAQTIDSATKNFQKFEYARAREAIEDFFWNDFCDNYLEICKVRAYGLNADKYKDQNLSPEQQKTIENDQLSAVSALKICLDGVLKLFAPFIPHICDEIYAATFPKEHQAIKSINARGTWPQVKNYQINENALEIGEKMLEIVAKVRKFKSDNNLSMKTEVSRIEVNKDISEVFDDLGNVCNAREVVFGKEIKIYS